MTVDKEVVSSIGRGVLVFAAVAPGDTEKEVDSVASKVLRMKLWDDETGGRVTGASFFPPRPRHADKKNAVEKKRDGHPRRGAVRYAAAECHVGQFD